MRQSSSVRTLMAGAIVTLVVPLATTARAAAIYTTSPTSYSAITNFTANSAGSIGYGDDYNLGGTGAVLTGLSFYGGLQSTNSQLFIDFYNASGVRVATITPSASEVSGFAVHTLADGDFVQNGITGVTIPGSGYVIFSPYSYATASPSGVTPANPSPTFSLAGGGSAPTVGTSSSTLSARTTPDPTTGLPVLSTGAFISDGFGGSPPQFFRVSLTGTVLPEPASLAMIAPVAAMAVRRRRATRAV